MRLAETEAIADLIIGTVKAATDPLLARIAALESKAAYPAELPKDGRDGRDGKDAPPVDLEALALKAASLIPRPQDGKDASVDLEALAIKAAALVPRPADGKDAPPVDVRALAAMAAALVPPPQDGKDAPAVDLDAVAVKAAALVVPVHGKDGINGTDADPSLVMALQMEVAALKGAVAERKAITLELPTVQPPDPQMFTGQIKALVDEAVSSIRLPKDGLDGKDGQSVDPEFVRKTIAEHVAAIPVPRDGKDGRDVDPVLLETVVSAQVERAVAAIEKPMDGKSLTPADVAPLIADEVTKAVAALPKAVDGVGVTDASIEQDGHLALTLTNGSRIKAGRVVGADADPVYVKRCVVEELATWPRPKDGEPGRDGLGFGDLDLTFDEQKGYALKASNGDRVLQWPLHVPWHMGIYKPGVTYPKSAQVTAQGSTWMALKATAERPGDGSTSWVLIVKRGRDGKDGKSAEGGQ